MWMVLTNLLITMVLKLQKIRCSFKIGVLYKNFTNVTGKHIFWSLFLIKKVYKFIKKGLQHRFFPVKFAKLFRSLFSHNTSSRCFWTCVVLPKFLALSNISSGVFDNALCIKAFKFPGRKFVIHLTLHLPWNPRHFEKLYLHRLKVEECIRN